MRRPNAFLHPIFTRAAGGLRRDGRGGLGLKDEAKQALELELMRLQGDGDFEWAVESLWALVRHLENESGRVPAAKSLRALLTRQPSPAWGGSWDERQPLASPVGSSTRKKAPRHGDKPPAGSVPVASLQTLGRRR